MSNIEVILVDIGNTNIKSVEVVSAAIVNAKRWKNFGDLDRHYPADIPFFVSSVKKITMNTRRPIQILSSQTKLPITVNYQTPDTLGADRMAAAVGANEIFPSKNSLIIDLGTCITVDVMDEKGIFHAGVISPGHKMRMQAMATFTDSLPDISNDWHVTDKGISSLTTKDCLANGTYWGVINEINGYLSYFRDRYPSLHAIITGGDAAVFASQIHKPIHTNLKIIETGLYKIWKFN